MKMQKRIYCYHVFFFALSIITCVDAKSSRQYLNSLNSGLRFTENKGQANKEFLYIGNTGAGTRMYFQKSSISYVLSRTERIEEDEEKEKKEQQEKPERPITKIHRVDLEFENANPNTIVTAEEKTNDYSRYYLPQCKDGAVANNYLKLTYKDLYPNIDVVFKGGTKSSMEYDFILKPGANPDDIKIKYKGAGNISLEKQTLIIQTSVGEIKEYIPESYQIINEKKVNVKTEYIFSPPTLGRVGEGILTFKLSNYNSNYSLIIDPWATYYGGSDDDCGTGIASDVNGNVLVTGSTASVDFPNTLGAYNTYGSFLFTMPPNIVYYPFGGDAFVVKLDVNGNRLWATYYGGNDNDGGSSIATDNSNNLVFTGYTSSTNFPISSGSFQTSLTGTNTTDAFVVKLDINGVLVWATYYGGSEYEWAKGIATDTSKNIVITGFTSSSNFPVLSAFQPNLSNNGSNAFVVKFDGNGNRQWATYYGGKGKTDPFQNVVNGDCGYGIATDNSGNVVFTGYTNSTDFPVSSGAFMTTFGGDGGGCGLLFGGGDAFVAKLSPGGIPLWSTYYGGSQDEYGMSITTDHSNNVVMIGNSISTDFPVSPGAYDPTLDLLFGCGETFLVKFNSNGTRLWATYFNATDDSEGSGIAVDLCNNVYISGAAENIDMPISAGAFQTSLLGSENFFMAKFDSLGNYVCSTYIGGSDFGVTECVGYQTIVVNGTYVDIVGNTFGNFPVTPGAFQTTYGGVADAFVIQLCSSSCNTAYDADFTADQTNVCVGTGVDYTSSSVYFCNGTAIYSWTFPGGNPSSSSLPNPTGIVYNTKGIYNVKLVIAGGTCGADSVTKSAYINVYDSVSIVLSPNISLCYGSVAALSATTNLGNAATFYTWSPSVALNNTIGTNVISAATATLVYYVSGVCGEKDSVLVTIWPLPSISLNPVPSVCINGLFDLTAAGTIMYHWSPSNYLSSTLGPVVTTSATSSITYSVIGIDANGCVSPSKSVIVYPIFIDFTSDISIGCLPLCVKFSSSSNYAPVSCFWDFDDGSTSNNCNPPKYCYKSPGVFSPQLTITDIHGCKDSITKLNLITVYPNPSASFVYAPQPTTIVDPVIFFTDKSLSNYPLTNWLWSFDENNDSSSFQNPNYSYQDTGIFTVQLIVVDSHGCKDTTYNTVHIGAEYIFYAPNSFTPNGDNVNDIFRIHSAVISSFNMIIFDRWGNKVFESDNINKGWDGKYKDKLAQEDVYLWKVTTKDYTDKDHSYTGRVTLIK